MMNTPTPSIHVSQGARSLTCPSVKATVQQTHAALESGRMDESGTHLVVKRLKRQFSKPLDIVSPMHDNEMAPSDFDRLPYFEWADEPDSYIGEEQINALHDQLLRQLKALNASLIIKGTSLEDIVDEWHNIKEANADMSIDEVPQKGFETGQKHDLSLSIAVYYYCKQHFDELNDFNYDMAAERYYDGAKAVMSVMPILYAGGDDSRFATLKKQYPKPPRYLPNLTDVFVRHECLEARNFLAFLLTVKDILKIDQETQEAVGKVIADLDALHKKEVPVSFVKFPGQTGEPIMPGTFPEEVVEEVPAEKLDVEPLYDAKFPEPQPDANARTPYKPRPKYTNEGPKGIMRKNGRTFLSPLRTPRSGDKPRVPRLRFQDKVAVYTPIVPLHERYGVRKHPSKRTVSLYKTWQQILVERLTSPSGPYPPYDADDLIGDQSTHHVPVERPEDQTLDEAGGFPSILVEKADGQRVFKPNPPFTKFDRFLEQTRRLVFGRGTLPDDVFPQEDETEQQDPELPMFDKTEVDAMPTPQRRSWIRSRYNALPHKLVPPPRATPKLVETEEEPLQTAQTPGEKKQNCRLPESLHLFLNDQVINEHGEIVPYKPLFPEADALLPISTQKHDAAKVGRQIHEEIVEAEERELRELEELKRQREQEQRRAEAEAARLREEEERRKNPAYEATLRLAQLGLRGPQKPVINSLPADWQTRVSAARTADPNVHLAKIGDGTAITRRDFADRLLPETAWLNDNMVNGAMYHVRDWVNQRADKSATTPPCALLPSTFYTNLVNKGPQANVRSAKRMAKITAENLLEHKTILIPVCKGSHWTLAVIFPQLKAVTHMDSFRKGPGEENVRQNILAWVKAVLGNSFKEEEWVSLSIDAPQQTNGWDCGVFAITNSLCVALGLDPKLSYTEKELPAQRHQLAAIILNGGFKGDFDLQDL